MQKSRNFFQKITLLTIFYHFFLLSVTFLLAQKFLYQSAVFLISAGILYKYKAKSPFWQWAPLMVITMWFTYDAIGSIHEIVRFPLQDSPFVFFDNLFFGKPLSLVAQNYLQNTYFSALIYDVLMISYCLYYFLPFFVFYYLLKKNPSILPKYSGQFIVLFLLNVTLYMVVPVTGPQYFHPWVYTNPLPFGPLGTIIYQIIQSLHPNKIDCFPSAHVSISLFAVYYALKHKIEFHLPIFALFLAIVSATILLRYHYLLDVLAAFPLTYLVIKGFQMNCNAADLPKENP